MLRRKRFWLGLIISVSFLSLFLARTDFSQIREAFAEADYVLAFASIPLYFVAFWFRTIRWRYLLRPVSEVKVARLYPVVLIGLMTNNVAPARVGELVRAFLVGEREHLPKSTALGTIAVDRAFDGLTLVAILGIVTAFSGANTEVKSIGVATAGAFLVATAVLSGLALAPRRGRAVIIGLIHLLPAGLALKIEGMLDSFLSGLVVIRSPSVLLKAAFFSCASWLVEGGMYFIVGEAFGLGVGFHVYLIILAGANLALSILASPGGVGPFEVATQQVLVFFSVSSASASAYALALHALLLGPVILTGFVLLWLSHLSLSEMLGVPKTMPPAPITRSQGVE